MSFLSRFAVAVFIAIAFAGSDASARTEGEGLEKGYRESGRERPAPGASAERQARWEERAFRAALANLDYFMRAGARADLGRGMELMASSSVSASRARSDTRRIFAEQEALLAQYRSVASDVYGYELRRNGVGLWMDIEGGVETERGLEGEFSACMVFREGKWLIWSLAID